jgi:hypothetical protein
MISVLNFSRHLFYGCKPQLNPTISEKIILRCQLMMPKKRKGTSFNWYKWNWLMTGENLPISKNNRKIFRLEAIHLLPFNRDVTLKKSHWTSLGQKSFNIYPKMRLDFQTLLSWKNPIERKSLQFKINADIVTNLLVVCWTDRKTGDG